MMKIIVCTKQVPATNEVKMDPVTNTIIREGVEAICNPFDTYAVEEALRIKEKQGAHITAISMGIPTVAPMLKEVVALGVDEAVLLTDRKFAGADTLATAYTLAKGIGKIGNFDLVICGKQATDGDTAQVGPSLAETLGVPHLTDVGEIKELNSKTIVCRRMTDDGYDELEMDLPCLITVTKEINTPRLPSILGIKKAQKYKVHKFNANICEENDIHIGLSGSPTQVVKTFIPTSAVECQFLKIKALADKLRELSNMEEEGN